mmetsp:Transcript_29146/g.58188  ORF Transcript_29146/g.58188 Transcript_29146/m.58188 type:complete len:231 (+) Transcript_29146:240-932(+)
MEAVEDQRARRPGPAAASAPGWGRLDAGGAQRRRPQPGRGLGAGGGCDPLEGRIDGRGGAGALDAGRDGAQAGARDGPARSALGGLELRQPGSLGGAGEGAAAEGLRDAHQRRLPQRIPRRGRPRARVDVLGRVAELGCREQLRLRHVFFATPRSAPRLGGAEGRGNFGLSRSLAQLMLPVRPRADRRRPHLAPAAAPDVEAQPPAPLEGSAAGRARRARRRRRRSQARH